MSILGVVRSGTVQGRGDTQYNNGTTRSAGAEQAADPRWAMSMRMSFWDRIEYFLSKVVPAANENKCGSPAIPKTPACLRKAIWASTMCWAPSTG